MTRPRGPLATLASGLLAGGFLALSVTAASPQSLQQRAAAAERRWAEYQEVLESSNPVARWEALRAALADENTGIRNNALWLFLHQRETLPVAVVPEPGGSIGPGDLPDLLVRRLRWNPAQHAFEGQFVSHGYAARATGELVEGTLQVRYERVRMPADFRHPADVPLTPKDMILRACTVVLAIAPEANALAGLLHCEGMTRTMKVRMPLG